MVLHVVFNKFSQVLWSFLESGEVMGYSRTDWRTWLYLLKITWRAILQNIVLFLLGFGSSSTVATLIITLELLWCLNSACHGGGLVTQNNSFHPDLREFLWSFWEFRVVRVESSGDHPQPWVRLSPFGQLTIRADGFYFRLCDRLAFLYVKYLGLKMIWICPPPNFGKFCIHNKILETGLKSKHEVDLCSSISYAHSLRVTLYDIYSKTHFHWNLLHEVKHGIFHLWYHDIIQNISDFGAF